MAHEKPPPHRAWALRRCLARFSCGGARWPNQCHACHFGKCTPARQRLFSTGTALSSQVCQTKQGGDLQLAQGWVPWTRQSAGLELCLSTSEDAGSPASKWVTKARCPPAEDPITPMLGVYPPLLCVVTCNAHRPGNLPHDWVPNGFPIDAPSQQHRWRPHSHNPSSSKMPISSPGQMTMPAPLA